jgi:hypothetical protein
MELPEFKLPVWMNKGEVKKLADTAYKWFSKIGNWGLWPLRQLDPMECSEGVLNLLAWQRDVTRFRYEPLSLFRLRVAHAYANAVDAGSVEGFKRIFRRLGVGEVEIEERIDGLDWDVIRVRLENDQLTGNGGLINSIIKYYRRTCRRYGWAVDSPCRVFASPTVNFTTEFSAGLNLEGVSGVAPGLFAGVDLEFGASSSDLFHLPLMPYLAESETVSFPACSVSFDFGSSGEDIFRLDVRTDYRAELSIGITPAAVIACDFSEDCKIYVSSDVFITDTSLIKLEI